MRTRLPSALAIAALFWGSLGAGGLLAGSARAEGQLLDAAPLKAQLAVDHVVPVVRAAFAGLDGPPAPGRLICRCAGLAIASIRAERSVPSDATTGVDRPLRIAHPPQGPPRPA